jgi:hypothetical protein
MIKLKDVIHYYIGCEVIVDGNERGRLMGANPIPNSIGQVYWDIITEEMKKDDEDFCMPYNDDPDMGELRIKPILRRLESMTEQEMKDVYMIERNRILYSTETDFDFRKKELGFIITRLDLLDVRLMIGFNGHVYKVIEDKKTPTIEPVNNHSLIFHYLLKCGFDMFGLINSGEAIDAPKQ